MSRYRKINLDAAYATMASKGMDEIVNLAAQFYQTTENRKYNEEQYEKELADRNEWRDKQQVINQQNFQDSQWLQYNIGLREEALTRYGMINQEYQQILEKYETIAGMDTDLDPLNQTEEFNNMLVVETEDALSESQTDLAQLNSMITDVDKRIKTYQLRMRTLNNVAVEISERSDSYKRFKESPIIDNVDIPQWSAKDFELMVADILADEEFLKENELLDERGNINLPGWLSDYFDSIKRPSDEKLQGLNTKLMEYESEKLKLESQHFKLQTTKAEWGQIRNPEIAHYTQVNNYTKTLASHELALSKIPAFEKLYTTTNSSVKSWQAIHADYSALNYRVNPDHRKLVEDLMIKDGYADESRRSEITEKDIYNYQQSKANIQLAQEDPLAMLMGPMEVKNIFMLKDGTYARYGRLLQKALEYLNNYAVLQNGVEQGDVSSRNILQQLNWEYARRLGMPTEIKSKGALLLGNDEWNMKVNQRITMLKLALSDLLGGKDADLEDNPFTNSMNNLQEIEQNIENLLANNKTSNLQDIGLFNDADDVNVHVTNSVAACTLSGGTWDSILEVCVDLSTDMYNKGLDTTAVQGVNTSQLDDDVRMMNPRTSQELQKEALLESERNRDDALKSLLGL